MTKITLLTELAAVPDTADEIAVVDKSDLTEATSGTTKRVSRANYLGYTEYVALITQTGANVPTAVVVKNDTGATYSYARTLAGIYSITVNPGVMVNDKTITIISQNNATRILQVRRDNTTTLTMTSQNSAWAYADSLLVSTCIVIRIYQ